MEVQFWSGWTSRWAGELGRPSWWWWWHGPEPMSGTSTRLKQHIGTDHVPCLTHTRFHTRGGKGGAPLFSARCAEVLHGQDLYFRRIRREQPRQRLLAIWHWTWGSLDLGCDLLYCAGIVPNSLGWFQLLFKHVKTPSLGEDSSNLAWT